MRQVSENEILKFSDAWRTTQNHFYYVQTVKEREKYVDSVRMSTTSWPRTAGKLQGTGDRADGRWER